MIARFHLEQRKARDIAAVVNPWSAPGFSFVSEDLTEDAVGKKARWRCLQPA